MSRKGQQTQGVVEEGAGSIAALPPVDEVTMRVSEPADVEVTLLKPHTHGDRDYAAGDKLTVRPPIAEWLRDQGVIEAQTTDPA